MNPSTAGRAGTRETAAPLGTADFAEAGQARMRRDDGGDPREGQDAAQRRPAPDDAGRAVPRAPREDAAELAPLFANDAAQQFRARWIATQTGFVDDPQQAVQQADELVAQVMRSLAQSFAHERSRLEAQMGEGRQASTEDLRVALRRYRSFFERLLSL